MPESTENFDTDKNAELALMKKGVYDYMMATRPEKYGPWLTAMKAFQGLANAGEKTLGQMGSEYFSDAGERAELIDNIYTSMRLADDIVDGDAPLPKGFSSTIEYIEDLISFLEDPHWSSDPTKALLGRSLELAEQIGENVTAELGEILQSLLFDAKRINAPDLKVFSAKELNRHFFMLDIRGTINACLKIYKERSTTYEDIETLGTLTRISYNLEDLEADLKAKLCNITGEDMEKFGITDLGDIKSEPIRRWRESEALRGLTLLREWRERKDTLSFHPFTRAQFILLYEQPAESEFHRTLRETKKL